jgi:hypothetical protein
MAKRHPIQRRKPVDLVAFSEELASQLIEYGNVNGLTGHEVLMGVVLAERLLMGVLPGAVTSVMEAHATFDAMTRIPAAQDVH